MTGWISKLLKASDKSVEERIQDGEVAGYAQDGKWKHWKDTHPGCYGGRLISDKEREEIRKELERD